MVNVLGREIKRPTVVCDIDDYVVLKIGEYEEMETYYKAIRKVFSSSNFKETNRLFNSIGLPKLSKPMERSIELIELPLNQELIDNVVGNSGYLKKYLNHSENDNVIRINFKPIE